MRFDFNFTRRLRGSFLLLCSVSTGIPLTRRSSKILRNTALGSGHSDTITGHRALSPQRSPKTGQ